MLHLKPMTMEDYAEAYRLWQSTPGVSLSGADEGPAVGRFLFRNPGLSYVCYENGALLGAVLCGHDGRRGFIYHLAVAESSRRKGIGRALVACVLDVLRREGIEKCHALVFEDNASGRDFWRACGFSLREDLGLFSAGTAASACGGCSCGGR